MIAMLCFVVGAQAAAHGAFDCALYASTCKGVTGYEAYKDCASTVSGNAFNATGMSCRKTHLALAAASGGAALHCPHAQPAAAAPCAAEKLKTFDCALYASTCKGVAGYQAYSNCESTVGMNNANDMACRIYHLGAAAAKDGAAVHCAHAAPDAAKPCDGEKLKPFDCALYASTCKGVTGYEAYGDCANTIAANGANGMSCRTHHLALAAKADGAALHCPHAQFNAKGPCASQTLKTFDCALYAKTCKDVAGYEAYTNCAGVVTANAGGMQCRLYHLSVAAAAPANAAAHCKHAAPKAEAPCATEMLKPAAAAPVSSAGFLGDVPHFCVWALILFSLSSVSAT